MTNHSLLPSAPGGAFMGGLSFAVGLLLLAKLFGLLNGRTAEALLAVRQERSRPLVADLEAWLRAERARLFSKNPVANAIHTEVDPDCETAWL